MTNRTILERMMDALSDMKHARRMMLKNEGWESSNADSYLEAAEDELDAAIKQFERMVDTFSKAFTEMG